ncbi:uncharacterized protein LOC106419598 [Brassica napus]|uniref:uncharacterized protein LOC106419598 n=1 Tax=Brassica napus TaxID=3708 RepID=UPI0006AAED37|nr:uncharacterized protein LOC106419598 [Brassica napus]
MVELLWNFVEILLEKLGFARAWIRWVMACISSVSYAVLLNSHSHGFIRPERGIRQGDPLSPFLYILCTEALVNVLNQSKTQGKLHGIKLSSSCPAVHHLLFADDSLRMCDATVSEREEIKSCLKLYGDASGQKIEIQEALGIMKEGSERTYLGLPECFKGSKKDLLNFIKEMLEGRLQGCILHGKELLKQGLYRDIGNGVQSNVWAENWIIDGIPRPPMYREDREVNLALEDSVSWGFTKNAPDNRVLPPLEKKLWNNIWKIKAPSKLKHFFWRSLSGVLAVKERLQTRGIQIDATCQSCGARAESISHVLFPCDKARQMWELANIPIPPAGFSVNSVFLNIFHLVGVMNNNSLEMNIRRAVPWVMWQIWKARNSLVFKNTSLSP